VFILDTNMMLAIDFLVLVRGLQGKQFLQPVTCPARILATFILPCPVNFSAYPALPCPGILLITFNLSCPALLCSI
jgi:hypothetical protein